MVYSGLTILFPPITSPQGLRDVTNGSIIKKIFIANTGIHVIMSCFIQLPLQLFSALPLSSGAIAVTTGAIKNNKAISKALFTKTKISLKYCQATATIPNVIRIRFILLNL